MQVEAPPASSEAPSSAATLVRLDRVGKQYPGLEALREVSLDVPAGEICGLVGPSGCGKTTLAKLVVGLSAPSAGAVSVFGTEPSRFSASQRERLGYAPQDFFLDPALTVQENCHFVGGLYGLGWRRRRRRIKEVLATLRLSDARDRLTRSLSGGMRRRLLLACALLHEPDLLVVDEPTSGLDPLLRREVWDHLRRLKDEGVSILLTTQYLDEADSCDEVAVLHEGRLIASGTPADLRARAHQADTVTFEVTALNPGDVALLWRMDGVRIVSAEGNELRVEVGDGAEATPVITRWLDERGAGVTSARTQIPTFDEVFIELVRSASEAPSTS